MRAERATTPEEAAAAADRIGRPVALKAFGSKIVHKTDLGAVQLGLSGATRVTAAAREMAQRLGDAGVEAEGFLVQEMVEGGVEMLVGVAHDPLFGPVVACSAGGTAVELVRDVAVRVTPLTDLDATEMVHSLKTFPLLDGFRGAPKADVPARPTNPRSPPRPRPASCRGNAAAGRRASRASARTQRRARARSLPARGRRRRGSASRPPAGPRAIPGRT